MPNTQAPLQPVDIFAAADFYAKSAGGDFDQSSYADSGLRQRHAAPTTTNTPDDETPMTVPLVSRRERCRRAMRRLVFRPCSVVLCGVVVCVCLLLVAVVYADHQHMMARAHKNDQWAASMLADGGPCSYNAPESHDSCDRAEATRASPAHVRVLPVLMRHYSDWLLGSVGAGVGDMSRFKFALEHLCLSFAANMWMIWLLIFTVTLGGIYIASRSGFWTSPPGRFAVRLLMRCMPCCVPRDRPREWAEQLGRNRAEDREDRAAYQRGGGAQPDSPGAVAHIGGGRQFGRAADEPPRAARAIAVEILAPVDDSKKRD
jgi:hypothetical protein